MCGIVGIIDTANRAIEPVELLALRDSVAHRGPDDAGIYLNPNHTVGLGHRRLSVIDLSEMGHQPMGNETDTIWVVFNGEIYNFQTLRTQLIERGHIFHSQTDTEVIIHAYEEWEEECVSHLLGMFAFVLYDCRKERCRIFMARDRVGKKPLFYLYENSRLVFASEVHSLYRYVNLSMEEIDLAALDFYLASGYVPPDRSIVRCINKLPPAHYLVFEDGKIESKRYWQVSFRPTAMITLEEGLDILDSKLRKAVERRLVSDVPLGSFLSGGIDSGLVTALAAQISSKPLHTFSVGFEDVHVDQDERGLAQLVAKRYNTIHEELVVGSASLSQLVELLWHYGEPFADSSALPTYQISKAARKHITVALTGDGGDESFAGYSHVNRAYWAQRTRQLLPLPVRYLIKSLLGLSHNKHAIRLHNWFEHYVEQPVLNHNDSRTHWHSRLRRQLYYSDRMNKWETSSTEKWYNKVQADADTSLTDAEMHLFTDLHLRLPGDYLTKIDIASSKVALEIRSPFLDHELIEFAAQLPMSLKLYNGQQKGLLRKLSERYLPSAVLHQPKRGFAPPLAKWLRNDWSSTVKGLLLDSLANRPDLFQSATIKQIVAEHMNEEFDHTQRLWCLLCLEIWIQLFVERTLKFGDNI